MTLTELHDDPAKMAAFFEWPYEDEAVIKEQIAELEYKINKLKELLYSGPQRNTYEHRYTLLKPDEATRLRYVDYMVGNNNMSSHHYQTHKQFIKECAKELGITGKYEEIRGKCLAARPDIYCTGDGKFRPLQNVASDAPPTPKPLRLK